MSERCGYNDSMSSYEGPIHGWVSAREAARRPSSAARTPRHSPLASSRQFAFECVPPPQNI
ncbi:hypothetical protein SFRURICE_001382 [Spodoptera frugiperda]|nr:hypothetical protein SFRURICE_001382 [Spodoptera frugiperda]